MIPTSPIYHPKPHHWKHSPLNVVSQNLSRTTSLAKAANTFSKMVLSFWFKENAGGGVHRPIIDWGYGSTPHLRIWITAPNKVTVYLVDPSSGLVISWTSTSTVPIGSWYHVLIYADIGTVPASRVVHCYVNGTLYAGAWDINAPTGAAYFPFAATTGGYNWNLFRDVTATYYLNCSIAQLWLCPETTFRDLSVAANRERFRNANGTPVFLGLNGAQPFGVEPLLYINGPAKTCHVNRSGGDVMTVNIGPMLDA